MSYILLFIFFLVLQIAYFKIANHFNIIDRPNERSSHKQITLLGGGVIFYVAILTYFVIKGFQYPWFFIGLTLISAISFIDDIKPLSSKIRLTIHLISILFLVFQLDLSALPWYYIILALILSTGVLNAYNFMDGINGMLGAFNIVVLGALWYINKYILYFADEKLIFYVFLALIVFNIFNFRKKARCFSGDVGAFSLAFTVVFLLGTLIVKSGNFIWIGLITVYGIDTALTIIHRLFLKENIFVAHRKHLFQLLVNELKLPHLFVSFVYALIQLLVSIGLVVFKDYGYLYLAAVIIVLSLSYYIIKKKYFYLYQLNNVR